MDALYIASLIGSFAFALSGYLLGARRGFDIMGLYIVAFISANGGGVLRDILLQKPISMLSNSEPFWLSLIVIVLGFVLNLKRYSSLEQNFFFVLADAIGLVAFAILGAMIAIELNHNFFSVVVISFITATGGGVLRDILMSEVSELFKGGFYGTIALIIASGIYVLNHFALLNSLSLLVVFTLALLLRLVAYHYEWYLPKG